MEQGYQNAMTLVGKFGKPNLFITFTANPNWPEIQNHLFKDEGQSAVDRPDLTVQVTRLKFQAFLKEITSGLFGAILVYVYTVEYQKCGLSHFHLLLFLDHKAPSYEGFLSPRYIDNIILAELPPPEIDPDGSLTKIVKSCMLHRKCGQEDPSALCTRNNLCEKGFPKPYQETTYTETSGYLLYCRHQDIPYIINGQQHLSEDLNRRIIPYNPYLIRRFNCYINVELVSSVKAIRYIFKYIYKGTDLTTLTIHKFHGNPQNPQNLNPQNDEITRWKGLRFMSPNEAVWRQFEFPVREQHSPVKALTVHLPDKNSIS
jgi:Helitron helicase-like domain at N-terminus